MSALPAGDPYGGHLPLETPADLFVVSLMECEEWGMQFAPWQRRAVSSLEYSSQGVYLTALPDPEHIYSGCDHAWYIGPEGGPVVVAAGLHQDWQDLEELFQVSGCTFPYVSGAVLLPWSGQDGYAPVAAWDYIETPNTGITEIFLRAAEEVAEQSGWTSIVQACSLAEEGFFTFDVDSRTSTWDDSEESLQYWGVSSDEARYYARILDSGADSKFVTMDSVLTGTELNVWQAAVGRSLRCWSIADRMEVPRGYHLGRWDPPNPWR